MSQGFTTQEPPQILQGYGFEQFYYSGALSASQLSTIFTYLNNKWAVY